MLQLAVAFTVPPCVRLRVCASSCVSVCARLSVCPSARTCVCGSVYTTASLSACPSVPVCPSALLCPPLLRGLRHDALGRIYEALNEAGDGLSTEATAAVAQEAERAFALNARLYKEGFGGAHYPPFTHFMNCAFPISQTGGVNRAWGFALARAKR